MSTVGKHLAKWKLTDISQAPKTLGDFSLRRNPLTNEDRMASLEMTMRF